MRFFSRTPNVVVDPHKIDNVLSRGVAETILEGGVRRKLLSGKRLRVKLGIDPTSPDLHIGRSIPLLKLHDFQQLGHQAVLIVGDFTATIGDTSDKDAERPMLTEDTIEKNKKTYFEQVGKILDLSQTELRYNSEWLKPLTYREIGEHADLFSVSDFIARDNIARRLEGGKRVSLRELLYPLMQGYDSVAVEADVELGGMDQKFNVLAGRPLQEHFKQPPQDILLTPLIDGLDGRKMSSSYGNTIALTAEPSDMYGKVMSMTDAQVPSYFELCTRVPMDEVSEVLLGHPKEAKMRLAREIVTMYHGADAAQKAEDDWTKTFSEGGVPEGTPTHSYAKDTPMLLALSEALGESNASVRRLFQQGAISEVGGNTIHEPLTPITRPVTLRVGKHRFIKLVVD